MDASINYRHTSLSYLGIPISECSETDFLYASASICRRSFLTVRPVTKQRYELIFHCYRHPILFYDIRQCFWYSIVFSDIQCVVYDLARPIESWIGVDAAPRAYRWVLRIWTSNRCNVTFFCRFYRSLRVVIMSKMMALILRQSGIAIIWTSCL